MTTDPTDPVTPIAVAPASAAPLNFTVPHDAGPDHPTPMVHDGQVGLYYPPTGEGIVAVFEPAPPCQQFTHRLAWALLAFEGEGDPDAPY